MRLTVAGSPGDHVVVTDIAIVTLKRPMTAERAMNMQFAVLGGLAQGSQDKKADQEAAKLSPRTMDSIRGVVECKASEVPVELTGSVGWPSVGAGMIATIYRKEEFPSDRDLHLARKSGSPCGRVRRPRTCLSPCGTSQRFDRI